MSRISLGGDIFSPVRTDSSLNESLSRSDMNAEQIKYWMRLSDPDKLQMTPRSKSTERNVPRNSNCDISDKLDKDNQHKSRGSISQSLEEIDNFSEDSLISSHSRRAGTVSRRNANRVDTNLNFIIPENRENAHGRGKTGTTRGVPSIQVQNRNLESMSKYITVREDGRWSDLSIEQKKSTKKSSSSQALTAEEKKERTTRKSKTSSKGSSKGNPSVSKSTTGHPLNLNSRNNKEQIESGQQCSSTNASAPDGPLENGTEKDMVMKAVSPELQVNQAAQIQADAIETLIKRTVSLEFEAVRQQLYHIEYTFLKKLNDMEDQHANVIHELMEENRQLRNASFQRPV